jgi:hypothetical protein
VPLVGLLRNERCLLLGLRILGYCLHTDGGWVEASRHSFHGVDMYFCRHHFVRTLLYCTLLNPKPISQSVAVGSSRDPLNIRLKIIQSANGI